MMRKMGICATRRRRAEATEGSPKYEALGYRIDCMVRRYLGYPVFELCFMVVILLMTLFMALMALRGCAISSQRSVTVGFTRNRELSRKQSNQARTRLSPE
jgi:hypothetical protein